MITIAFVMTVAAATPATTAQTQIRAAMADSAVGWNTGDLDRFMRVYSDAPDTSFVVKDGIITGKAAIADRYRPGFTPGKPARGGTLSFQMIRFTLLDPRHALLVARYRLKFAGKTDVTGPTSLVFVRDREGWKISADHSS